MPNPKYISTTAGLEAILESISDGVFTVNSRWQVTSFNRAAEKITGITRQEAIGKLCSEVFKSSMCETACALRKTLKTKTPIINKTCFIINAQGKRIPISVSTAVLRDHTGKIIGGAETFRDLSEIEQLRNDLKEQSCFGGVICHSKAMMDIMELARAVANSPSTVLIEGETGSGKEVIARAIHKMSPHNKEPFIAVNCGALPDSLLESELFGYKKGAFTGADNDKLGRFALAGKGTLFLDEIGEITPALQVKLLRVLQERTYEPLGAITSQKSEARIIVATHRNLEQLIIQNKFRQDLYYRINILTLKIPPLRQRLDDIPLLVEHFINKFNQQQARNVTQATPELFSLFMNYDWPGNVRELENIIERAFVLCGNSQISIEHLPNNFATNNSIPQPQIQNVNQINTLQNQNERTIIVQTLTQNNYNRSKTAKQLGIHKTTLYRKINKLNINLPEQDGRTHII